MDLRDLLDVRSPEELSRHERLLVLYALGLVGIILFYTVVYNAGIGRSRAIRTRYSGRSKPSSR